MGKVRTDIVYKLKMVPAVAAYTAGKPFVALAIPLVFPPGTRLWMVEYIGAPTGRADLCTVIGNDGNLLVLERRYCFRQGKFDDDLSDVSLTITPSEYRLVDKSAIPEEKDGHQGQPVREDQQRQGS